MHNKKSSFSCTVFLFALLAAGCIQQGVVHPDYPPEKILAAIPGAVNDNEILSAVAKIDLITKQGYNPVRAALIIKKPSYLRLELLPMIGTPDFLLAASPEKMSIFIPSRRELYSGLPTGDNLARFLPWQFDIEDIVMIFSGNYPSFKEKAVVYQSYPEENLLRIEMKAPSGCSQTVWVGENNRLMKFVRNNETGKEVYTVKYFYGDTGDSVPEKINISMADGITSLSIKYSDVKIEKVTDLSIFDLPVSGNVKIIPLE